MTTTNDEQPAAEKADEVIVARSVTKAEVLDAYEKGHNYYQLAREFFDSEGDEAVERVRRIVEGDAE